MALGAAVQAGMLEGSLPDLMVMDVWQAGLLRALATQQLRSQPEVASRILGDRDVDPRGAEVCNFCVFFPPVFFPFFLELFWVLPPPPS